MNNKIFCNNCGRHGHNFRDCIEPITSIGIIAYTYDNGGNRKYLMIRRRDTLGFVDFMRGKYNVNNKQYLLNILNEMTIQERENILSHTFDELWDILWGKNISIRYLNEKITSKHKFDILQNGVSNNEEKYTLEDLINECTTKWKEQEWGFPKGRRDYKECDLSTALREFSEETGIILSEQDVITNIAPIEEVFIGSNFKLYKHKYYLAEIKGMVRFSDYEKTEVSKVTLMSYDQCLQHIREYNIEKKNVLKNVELILNNYKIINLD